MPRGNDGTPRTTFNDLLTEIKGLLSRNIQLAPERIFRLMRRLRSQTNIKAQKFIVLRPGGAKVDGNWHDSEGRLCVAVERELIICPYLQESLDDVTSNDRITQDFLAFEDLIVDLVDIYEPEFALEPIHFLGITAEQSAESVESEGVTPLWATSSLSFSVKFLQAVNQSRQ